MKKKIIPIKVEMEMTIESRRVKSIMAFTLVPRHSGEVSVH